MSKKPDVNAALLQSLKPKKTVVAESSPNNVQAEGEETTPSQSPKKKVASTKPRAPSKPVTARGTVLRQNVTLFEKDVEIIDRITDCLAKRGIRRVALSACIRIALRLTSEDPSKIIQTFEEIREEDGRTKEGKARS